MKLLRVSSDKRHLETEDGKRFYLLGDTAWELFHALDREEASSYLSIRKEQGFNMIQAVVLAELKGLTVPNAYGRTPLLKNSAGEFDPLLPDLGGNYSYFDHVEFIVSKAEELGLYIGMLPTWGDKWNRIWGDGPEIFTPENACGYGKWLAERFSRHTNLIWILGGDRPLTEERHFRIIDAMAKGLKEGDGGRFLMTLHPTGSRSSSEYLAGREWIDFHMNQSGHGFPTKPCYELLAEALAADTKPAMDGEPCYEDHAINFKEENGYFDAVDVRLAAWRNLLSGACGNTYGHSSVWCMRREPTPYWPNTWQTSLRRPGAEALRVYRDFIMEHDLTAFRPVGNAVKNNSHDANYVACMVSENTAWLYVPCGAPVEIEYSSLPFAPESMRLFEPTAGSLSDPMPFPEDGRIVFPARGAGRGMDYLLEIAGPAGSFRE